MGLLDDAIRDHLELKRRRGADPSEVAREQREALDAVPRRGADSAGGDERDEAIAGNDGQREGQVAAAEIAPVAAVPADVAQGAQPDAEAAAGVDETAELDMRTVLGEDDQEASTEEAPRLGSATAEPAPRAPDASSAEDDALEWEVPGEVAEEPVGAEVPDEDVLEETPDFLRDTPEQERLWFEQRPPRDFDFDK